MSAPKARRTHAATRQRGRRGKTNSDHQSKQCSDGKRHTAEPETNRFLRRLLLEEDSETARTGRGIGTAADQIRARRQSQTNSVSIYLSAAYGNPLRRKMAGKTERTGTSRCYSSLRRLPPADETEASSCAVPISPSLPASQLSPDSSHPTSGLVSPSSAASPGVSEGGARVD
jgi:hypothetical protein